MLPWDPNGKIGPKKPLPDHVNVAEPKDEQPMFLKEIPLPVKSADATGLVA